jgi:hypothetical protein
MPDDHRWERKQIEAALAELERFYNRCAHDAERMERVARFWGGLHVSLGLPAAVLAAVAGVAALADFSPTASGIVALAAAALSAMTTFLGGSERQRQAKAMADGLRALATEAENFVRVDSISPHGKLDAPYLFKDFNERMGAVRAGQPLPEMWWRGRPAHAYSSDELDWLME